MDFSQNEVSPVRRYGGLSIVALLHMLVAYALITGLARKVVDVIKQPVETRIIEEMRPPPPDKPPPPPPKLLAPPPPFMPPPEVQIQQPVQQNTIAAVTTVKPESKVLPPIARAEPAPVAAPVHIAAVVDPRACQKPDYPRSALLAEETGVVTLAFLIGVDGRVIDSRVENSSGYKELDKAARAGLSLCKFKPGTFDGKPEQSWMKMQYVWKLED
ncbi:MAG: energy transducer TonB [Burkholderiales bacterium]